MISVLPLLLLIAASYSIFVYQRTSGELARVLAAGTAVVCLIWGLAIAHWSFHILGLLVLLQSGRLSLLSDSSSQW
ncbi:MAG: hypothetical protein SW833_10695 [Cyanobacteriota bacterium]|nr:hypothetical protein [Cyanobacteriota bacterium]